MKIPVIIDCDPGHDDVVAITLALSSPKLDVKGIVTVAGNNTLDKVTNNALKALELLGRNDIPVVRGSDKPREKELQAAKAHGKTGLDGPVLPEATAHPRDVDFIEFYREILESSEQKVTIFPIGPLTNIDAVFTKHPHLMGKVEVLNIMGGANMQAEFQDFRTHRTNSEFNIWQDAEAAADVFELPLKINMFGLDLTCASGATQQHIDRFRTQGGRVGKVVAELLDYYFQTYKRKGLDRCPVHDACPVAYTLAPELFDVEQRDISVNYTDAETYGETLVDMQNPPRKQTYWARSVQYEAFMDMLLEACKSYQ